jgi:hypothetical protein
VYGMTHGKTSVRCFTLPSGSSKREKTEGASDRRGHSRSGVTTMHHLDGTTLQRLALSFVV